MKIAYLTQRDAQDKRVWSGTLYYMAKSLTDHVGEVIHVGPYHPKYSLFIAKTIRLFSRKILRKNYNVPHSNILARSYQRYFSKKINRLKPDIIFAAAASTEMSRLATDIPIVYLGDITFKLLKETYPNYQNLTRFSDSESEKIEQKTFEKSSALIFSSTWSAESAKSDYNVPESNINIVSFGANLDTIPTMEQIAQKRIDNKIKLLFLGTDWHRKGGDLVIRTFKELVAENENIELTVCGAVPPEKEHIEGLTVIPFLDKNRPADAKKLYALLLDSHLMFVPSRSDCTPIVFCEANAFGLPVLTTNVGGITSVINDGQNGKIIRDYEDISKYKEFIRYCLEHPDYYHKLAISSRKYYDTYLNWDQWGKAVGEVFRKVLKDY